MAFHGSSCRCQKTRGANVRKGSGGEEETCARSLRGSRLIVYSSCWYSPRRVGKPGEERGREAWSALSESCWCSCRLPSLRAACLDLLDSAARRKSIWRSSSSMRTREAGMRTRTRGERRRWVGWSMISSSGDAHGQRENCRAFVSFFQLLCFEREREKADQARENEHESWEVLICLILPERLEEPSLVRGYHPLRFRVRKILVYAALRQQAQGREERLGQSRIE